MTGPDSIRLYLDDIGRHSLLTKQDEQELAQTMEWGGFMTEARQLAPELGKAAMKEVTQFVRQEEARDLDEATAWQRQGSPYFSLLKAVVEVSQDPEATKRAVQDAAAARQRFINSNLRLVVSVAKNYPSYTGMGLLDYIQEGNLGLEHAVDKFDWRKGFKFSTYATNWITQAIGRGIDGKASLIHIPVQESSALRAALRLRSKKDVALSPEHAELERLTSYTSLSTPVGENGTISLGDLIPSDASAFDPQAQLDRVAERQELENLLNVLTDPLMRMVIELRFGFDDGVFKTERTITSMLGIPHNRTQRLLRKGLIILRDNAESVLTN